MVPGNASFNTHTPPPGAGRHPSPSRPFKNQPSDHSSLSREPDSHHRSPRYHWVAQNHLVELFIWSGDDFSPWEWSRGCPGSDQFSQRSSRSVVLTSILMDITRPLDEITPGDTLCEATHVKTAPKNDNRAGCRWPFPLLSLGLGLAHIMC